VKIHSVGAESILADRRTGGQTWWS